MQFVPWYSITNTLCCVCIFYLIPKLVKQIEFSHCRRCWAPHNYELTHSSLEKIVNMNWFVHIVSRCLIITWPNNSNQAEKCMFENWFMFGTINIWFLIFTQFCPSSQQFASKHICCVKIIQHWIYYIAWEFIIVWTENSVEKKWAIFFR